MTVGSTGTYPYGTTGYSCYSCGSWVPSGTIHTCNGSGWGTSGYTWVFPEPPKPIEQLIAEAAESVRRVVEEDESA